MPREDVTAAGGASIHGHTDPPHPTGSWVVWGVLRDLRGQLLLSAIAALGWQGVVLLVPVVLGWVVAEAIEQGHVASAWWGVVAIVGLAAAEALFDLWRHRLENQASAVGAGRLRRSVLRGVLQGSVRPEVDAGDVVSRGTDDADVVAALLDSLGYTVAYALSVPVALLLLAVIDPSMAGLCLVAMLVGVASTRLVARPLDSRSDTLQAAAAATVSEIQAVLPAQRAARGLGVLDVLRERLSLRSTHLGEAAMSVADIRIRIAPVGALASAAPVIGVLLWGGLAVADGTLGVGALTAAIGLALYMVAPLEAVIDQVLELRVAGASAARIAEVAAPEACGPLAPGGVGRRAPGDSEPLAPDRADPLVMSLARSTGPVALRHDPHFWSASLRDNLALGRDLSDHALQTALDAAELHDVQWSDGLATSLTDAGAHLSGGQRQRLALARALLHAGPIEVGNGLDGVGPAQRERLAVVAGRMHDA